MKSVNSLHAFRRTWLGLACVCFATSVVLTAQTTQSEAETADGNPSSPPWIELEYHVHKLFLTIIIKVRLDFVSSASVSGILQNAPTSSPVPLPLEKVASLTVESDLPFGRSEIMRVWFDPQSGAAVQSDKLTLGRRNNHVVSRYLKEGIFSWISSPANKKEEKLPPEAWSNRRERFSPYPAELPPDGVVTDAYALIYLAKVLSREPGDNPRRFFVLSYHGFLGFNYSLQNDEQKRMEIVENGPSGKRPREGYELLRPLRVSTYPVPENPAATPHDLSLLGFQGGVTVFLDPKTGIPFILQGRGAYIGTLTSELVRVHY